MNKWLSFLIVLLLSLSSAWAIDFSDPSYDPKTDPKNILKYIPDNTLTTVGFVCYLLVGLSQTYMTFRYGARHMLYMVVAAYTYSLGLVMRYGLHSNPQNKNLYIAENTLVVLSPCGFIAANYVLLGRLSRWLKGSDHLWIRPTRIAVIFVASDITTFLIQGTGGGLTVTDDPDRAKLGQDIFLAGLILQLVSFALFTIIYLRFLYRVRKYEPYVWRKHSRLPFLQDWRSLAFALCISAVGVLVRSFYRVVELAQGYSGYLATTEVFFYALDALPLFIATAVFVPFWPGRYIPPTKELLESESVETELGVTPGASGHTLLYTSAA
ncbi:RTA1-domain-containing protein [Panus rudis PR-1116 ss-1]|nr:RTA1-domain-containing protein [Panus rudis PR-1116 ss-1]